MAETAESFRLGHATRLGYPLFTRVNPLHWDPNRSGHKEASFKGLKYLWDLLIDIKTNHPDVAHDHALLVKQIIRILDTSELPVELRRDKEEGRPRNYNTLMSNLRSTLRNWYRAATSNRAFTYSSRTGKRSAITREATSFIQADELYWQMEYEDQTLKTQQAHYNDLKLKELKLKEEKAKETKKDAAKREPPRAVAAARHRQQKPRDQNAPAQKKGPPHKKRRKNEAVQPRPSTGSATSATHIRHSGSRLLPPPPEVATNTVALRDLGVYSFPSHPSARHCDRPLSIGLLPHDYQTTFTDRSERICMTYKVWEGKYFFDPEILQWYTVQNNRITTEGQVADPRQYPALGSPYTQLSNEEIETKHVLLSPDLSEEATYRKNLSEASRADADLWSSGLPIPGGVNKTVNFPTGEPVLLYSGKYFRYKGKCYEAVTLEGNELTSWKYRKWSPEETHLYLDNPHEYKREAIPWRIEGAQDVGCHFPAMVDTLPYHDYVPESEYERILRDPLNTCAPGGCWGNIPLEEQDHRSQGCAIFHTGSTTPVIGCFGHCESALD